MSKRLLTLIGGIALVGLGEALYLAVLALTGETAVCGDSIGCSEVLGSSYAKIAGIPVAAIGALGYFSVFACSVYAAFGHRRFRNALVVMVLLMFGVTCWLLFVQAFILHAFCRYCLFSASLIFVMAGLLLKPPLRPTEGPPTAEVSPR